MPDTLATDVSHTPPATDVTVTEPGLDRIERVLELPMLLLGLVWLALVIAELVMPLPSWLDHVTTAIWGVFVADFALRFALTDDRARYVKRNWLSIIALVVPALRVFRVARVVRVLRATRAVRGVRAIRLVTTFGRVRRSIHALLAKRNALGYVVAVSIAVAFLGAAGMYSFELGTDQEFEGYGHALWWTIMLLMTMGTDIWPRSAEGRVLSSVLALYGFAVLGYITASLASWFVGRNRDSEKQRTN